MTQRIKTIFLAMAVLVLWVALLPLLGAIRVPGNNRGYEPEQPIAFSHRLHAGEMSISCLYCHSGAEKSRHAGIPAASTCMNCHRSVRASSGRKQLEEEAAEQAKKEGISRPARPVQSAELQKLYDALALDNDLKRDPKRKPVPIEWMRIHKLPDYVFFDHRSHTTAGVDCVECHGAVENMERVRQVGDLTMGWCLDCHRDSNKKSFEAPAAARKVKAPLDCSYCHY